MSFTDPLSITISAVTTPLPRIDIQGNKSVYQSSDGLLAVTADHSYDKRTRRVLRLDTSKMTPDPFRPAENVKVSMSSYMVFDLPPAGYTNAEALAAYVGFKTLYTATSDLMITKLLGGES
ncbi:coat protein [ssRNA phage Zoerhiza.2_15]|uniref:Coat protein n=2 Tax=Leviviricetes TaxID=2842243 RepID=A0A8S5L2U4_9VIRU|nr:coat protein [ssRNA phage Zoerhiza.2_15]QDH87386.1 MAG: hypothetical protein H2Rhizo32382_000004 [Leviviridae sp.]DAD52126.1 TPA_asm: coat protein [ssRNA phage Zoerhiza.2_15]